MLQLVETREHKPMPQRAQMEEYEFSERVIAAFADLAQLSLCTTTLHSSSTESLNQFATDLLTRLIALCNAQRGAIFLTPSCEDASFGSTFLHQPVCSLLVSAQMNAEEAQMTLNRHPLTTASLQSSSDVPPTLVWRRVPGLSGQTAHSPVPRIQALVLLEWPSQDSSLEERSKAMRLLPFVATAVDALLSHLLMALQERDNTQELFPTELLATVGHEFRGPLTTISGYATTLMHHDRQLDASERLEFLGAISEASAHLSKLVDRFLDLAQFETSAISFTPAVVDLAALAQEAVTMTRKNRGHPLILTPPPLQDVLEEGTEQSTEVCGDQRWLRTMLDLFLDNAIAYSPPESVIEVSVEPVDLSQFSALLETRLGPDSQKALILPGSFASYETLVEMQISDHGMGIPPEHLTRIFQRFYRVDTSLTREVNGLGLGLALCKAIVARHQGILWVESMPGAGSTFHILFPCTATQAAREMI